MVVSFLPGGIKNNLAGMSGRPLRSVKIDPDLKALIWTLGCWSPTNAHVRPPVG